MRLAWATDLHLDWLATGERHACYEAIAATGAEVVLLGGDIGNARSVEAYLAEIERALERPVYFVLGNHDFYHGSIAEVRRAVRRQAELSSWLRYLPAAGPVELSPGCVLLGHDGWADGRLGDFFGSPVTLNDYLLIDELRNTGKPRLYRKLNALGDEAADYLEKAAHQCVAAYRQVLVLTHVPPFREACWHEGRISNDLYLPHFACGVVGDRLAALMREHPESSMTVLCGHTHSPGFAQPLPNLEVHTGGAEYGHPAVTRVWEV